MPFHKEEKPSFFIKPKINKFVCYGCKEYGGAVALAVKLFELEESGLEKAIDYFAKRLNIVIPHNDCVKEMFYFVYELEEDEYLHGPFNT